MIIGILCFSNGAGLNWSYVLSGLLIGCTAILLFLNINYKKLGSTNYKLIIYCSFFVYPFILGGWLTLKNDQRLQKDHFSKFDGDYLKVEINEEPRLKNNILSLRAKVLQVLQDHKATPVTGQLLISVELDTSISLARSHMKYGDQLFIPASYKEIVAPRNPYEFDMRNWYGRQNFYHQAFLQQEQVLRHKTSQGNPIYAWALEVRQKQVARFRSLIRNDEAYAVASTLILGYRADLSEETLMAYSKTGTIHALSVSGMHVGLIYLIINFFLSIFERGRYGPIFKLLVAVSLIWLYAIIAGLAPSVLRSAIMLTIYILGSTFKRQQNGYNLLCFSAFMMLLYNPLMIYDVGFQLSYLSVFGLIFLQPLIYGWFEIRNFLADKLWNFFALSLAAQFVTFPLAIYYFHQFPLYFLISNLFILVPVSLIMYIGLAIIILKFNFLAPIFEWLIKATNLGLQWIANLPLASLSGIWINKTELLLLCLALITGCIALLKYNKLLSYISLTCFCLMTLSAGIGKLQSSGQKRIIFFSIRNQTAIALLHRDQAWILTNLYAGHKSLRFYVNPALEQSGVKQVSYLSLHESFNNQQVQLKDHQLRFFDYRILLTDSCFNGKIVNKKLNFNAINLCQHTRLDLQQLLEQCHTERLVIDGSNTIYQAQKHKDIAHNFNIPTYDLGIKKAYLINLIK